MVEKIIIVSHCLSALKAHKQIRTETKVTLYNLRADDVLHCHLQVSKKFCEETKKCFRPSPRKLLQKDCIRSNFKCCFAKPKCQQHFSHLNEHMIDIPTTDKQHFSWSTNCKMLLQHKISSPYEADDPSDFRTWTSGRKKLSELVLIKRRCFIVLYVYNQ